MSFRLLLFGLACVLSTTIATAQGLHFTQYNLSPLTLNPALSGKYEGTFRIGGIARDQWRAVPNANAYQTQSLYLDSPLLKGFKRGDWIGLGVMAFNDVVSVGKLKHSAFKISGAYHLALDRKAQNVISFGAQFGSESRSVTNNFRYELDILSGVPSNIGGDPFFSTDNEVSNDNFNNWAGGVMINSKLNKTTNAQVGIVFNNLTKPDYSVKSASSSGGGGGAVTSVKSRLARRAVVHGKFDAQINKLWTISPSFVFQTTAKQDEIIVQALAGYLWDAKRDLTFNMGLSYRLADAVSPMLGARYKKLTLGFAYDIRTGQVLNKATGGRGGMEIAAFYIQKIYKQPKVKTKILCPRF
jgi:type IX secretion system PorP/SprF family membrane protein